MASHKIDFIYTAINQGWKLIAGLVMVLLIPIYLTPEAQGYWFTITGLAFLMMFADLGFSNIILQFSAHEFAHLRFDKYRKIEGDPISIKKLGSFFLFGVKWALFALIYSIPIIIIIGIYLLSRHQTSIHWLIPWLIYIAGAALNFFNSMLLYFFEGCDSVALCQKMRLVISVLNIAIMAFFLMLGFSLFSLSASLLLSAVIGLIYIFAVFKNTIFQLLHEAKHYPYDWGIQFFPLFSRYAVSFISGYFIFQIYTPLMFYFHGAVEAGRVGLTMSLWLAVYSLSNSWVQSATPKANMHVSRKEWLKLDQLFYKRTSLGAITFLLGAFSVFFIFILFKDQLPFLNRLSGNMTMLILCISWFFQVIINSLAVYLRAHKQEPLMVLSAMSAIYISITTLLCAIFLRPSLFFLGFISNYLWSVPWVIYIFLIDRKAWHK